MAHSVYNETFNCNRHCHFHVVITGLSSIPTSAVILFAAISVRNHISLINVEAHIKHQQKPCCRRETARCHCKFRSIRIVQAVVFL